MGHLFVTAGRPYFFGPPLCLHKEILVPPLAWRKDSAPQVKGHWQVASLTKPAPPNHIMGGGRLPLIPTASYSYALSYHALLKN